MTANAIAPTSTARPPRTTAGFALLGTVQATLIFTLMAISVPLPDIGREFGLDHSDLVLLNAAYGLSFAALLLLGGRLTDRYGGRRVLTGGLLVLGLAAGRRNWASAQRGGSTGGQLLPDPRVDRRATCDGDRHRHSDVRAPAGERGRPRRW